MNIPAEVLETLRDALSEAENAFAETQHKFGDYTDEEVAEVDRKCDEARAWLASLTVEVTA